MSAGVLTLGAAQVRDLQSRLQSVRDDAGVRVVVLCAGPVSDAGHAGADAAAVRVCAELMRQLPQPVIAMLQGDCDGDTLALVAGCDVVFAADDTRFVVQDAPGQAFDAREAERRGIVTFACPASSLQARVDTLAAEFAARDALLLQFTKQALQQSGTFGWDEAVAFNAASAAALKAAQADGASARAAAVASFLAGHSKPGLGR